MGNLFYGCRINLPLQIPELGFYSTVIYVTSTHFALILVYSVAALAAPPRRVLSGARTRACQGVARDLCTALREGKRAAAGMVARRRVEYAMEATIAA